METLIVTGKRYKEYEKDSEGKIVLDENGQKKLTDKDLTDKHGKQFCVLEFSTPATTYRRSNATGQMTLMKRPQVSVDGYSAWAISNLPSLKGKPDFGWDLEIGEEVQGTIVKRSVQPYKVAGREVSTASVVSFADTEDKAAFELDVQAQFRRKGHTLADNTQPIADMQNIKNDVPVKAEVKHEINPQEAGSR